MTMKVTGRGLEFRDSSGRVRARLEMEADDDLALIAYDELGNELGRPLLVAEATGRLRTTEARAVVAADIALSANWGTTTISDINVSPNSTELHGRVTITAQATTGANPTVTLTFPGGAFVGAAPRAIVVRNGGSGSGSITPAWSGSPSTTALVWTAQGTPVAGSTYSFEWHVFP
jgi:hypothetical protein